MLLLVIIVYCSIIVYTLSANSIVQTSAKKILLLLWLGEEFVLAIFLWSAALEIRGKCKDGPILQISWQP